MPEFGSQKEALDFLTYHFRAQAADRKEDRFQSLRVYLDRAAYLCNELGNPQRSFRFIHIAGTSGKGSTAHILSQLLVAHGQATGVYTSPHLLNYRERFVVNGQMISEAELLKTLQHVLVPAEKMAGTSFGKPSFFEISNAIAYCFFKKQTVKYGVIETHVGGMNDTTNTETSAQKVSLITEIGLDHQGLLGDTLTAIAYQKAGIISEHSQVFALACADESNNVIMDTVRAKQADLAWIRKHDTYKNVRITEKATTFDYSGTKLKLSNIEIALPGEHQVRNACLALMALEHIAHNDGWSTDEASIRMCLQNIQVGIGGRIEQKVIQGKPCFFDVAHNEQKVSALVETLKAMHPLLKFTFLLAFKKGKAFENMIDLLAPLAAQFIVTGFTPNTFDTPFTSVEPEEIVQYLSQSHQGIASIAEPDAIQAFTLALKKKDPVVITGSFYIVSQILQDISQ